MARAVRGSNPDRAKKFFSPQNVHIGSVVNPACYSISTGFLSQGTKQTGCEVNHLLPSNPMIKNECSYMFTPPVCLRGVDR
jgi:hypothetical protein